jgi:hypothetical protein
MTSVWLARAVCTRAKLLPSAGRSLSIDLAHGPFLVTHRPVFFLSCILPSSSLQRLPLRLSHVLTPNELRKTPKRDAIPCAEKSLAREPYAQA